MLASDRTVLYENVAIAILVLSTEKFYSSFLKKDFVFHEIWFKVKVSKTCKTFNGCHIKHANLSKKKRVFWKTVIPFLEKSVFFVF